MTQMLERAMQRLKELPEETQDSIAEKILLEIDEAQWTALFDRPESQAALETMAEEALKEHRAGKTKPLIPENL
jgi:hypothetical protein